MRNTGDNPVRRAAGMILWKQTRTNKRTGERYTLAEAVAIASSHEPTLTEEQLRYAIGWAAAAEEFARLANCPDCQMTMAELLDKSALSYYRDRANQPEGV